MVPVDDGASPAPIDRAVLESMRSLFANSRMVDAAEIVADGNLHLRVALVGDYYPEAVDARFEIRWYQNDDFAIHYQEKRHDGVWKCRWDRHPNTHNAREHFHPPPDASRINAEDTHWPNDHRDICRLVCEFLRERIRTLWR